MGSCAGALPRAGRFPHRRRSGQMEQFTSEVMIGGDGTVYFGSYDHKLYALDRDGHKRWEFLAGNVIIGTPALAADGTIYLGAQDGKLYALGADGAPQW